MNDKEEKNKLTYGKLPISNLCAKLLSTSFSTPQKNLMVYRYCMKVMEHSGFLQNEKEKIINKYGEFVKGTEYVIPKANIDSFNSSIKSLLETEIEEELPALDLTEEDFSDENCCYSKDKSLWLSPAEISTILNIL